MLLFERAMSVLGWQATGSSFICNPPVLDTDQDFVLFTATPYNTRKELEALGYTYSSKDAEKYKLDETEVADPFQTYNSFDAYRHPDNNHNLIVVNKAIDFTRWKVATLVAKELNLKDKATRVMLFRAIRSGGTLYQPAATAEEALTDKLDQRDK